MTSSNRHWPSMFKSKPTNTHHHQWQHDISSSLISTTPGFHRGGPFSSGCEERSPEPKPRWNPKPEQIRILEAIFNSGMVNPPRDEIRKIRGQLQEYGQVGDANVFYWFQNRKSRSKHKNRHPLLQNPKTTTSQPASQNSKITTHNSSSNNNNVTIMPSSSSSSSSEKSSSQDNINSNTINSPSTISMNHEPYFFTSSQGELIAPDPFLFQVQQQQQQQQQQEFSQGFYFSDSSNVVQMGGDNHLQQNHDQQGRFSLSELMMNNNNNTNHEAAGYKKVDDEKMKLQNEFCFSNAHHIPIMATATTAMTMTMTTSQTVAPPLGLNQYQGVGESGGMGGQIIGSSARSTVFINDVACDVSCESGINVHECFGDDAVLLHSTGQPVLTNDWGVTLNPLIHGATYILVSIYSDIS